ncbi:hypothetical protein ACMFMF_010817 [Clarireedia jacksonii]
MSTTLASLAQEGAPPLLKVRLPFTHRMNCFLRIWILKAIAYIVFTFTRLVHRPPPSLHPTLIRYYLSKPTLQTRIFFPSTYKSGDKLPIYLNIHGGGFAICDPRHDDDFCVMWAKRTGMLVVSLDYSKAPLSTFPTPVYEIAALANAVLADSSLPIDETKIVIGGFSAGGNLALCAAQLPELKGRIKAALTFYPIVDWSHPPNEKLDMRPYKGGPKDQLEYSSYWFDWAYVPVGQNRRDPLLSPCYARRENLPPWIYIVGAQWDMLRLESQEMIHHLAGLDGVEDPEEDFEVGTYKWTLARGCSHGFTHHFGQSEKKKKKREEKCEPIYEEAKRWIHKALIAEGKEG